MPELGVLASVKEELGISDTTYDTLLTSYLNTAERSLCDLAGRMASSNGSRLAASGSITLNVPAIRLKVVRLDNWPVSSITSVREYTADSTYTDVPSTHYRLDSDQRTLRLSGNNYAAWDYGRPYINTYGTLESLSVPIRTTEAYPYTQIVYVGGFTTDSAQAAYPHNLVQAIHDFAKQIFLSRDRDGYMESEQLGKYSYTLNTSQMNVIRDRVVSMYLPDFMPPPL